MSGFVVTINSCLFIFFVLDAVTCSYEGKIAGLYDLGKTLGSGHFAVVKIAKHVFTGEKVAVKVIDKTKLDDVSKEHLFQEVRSVFQGEHRKCKSTVRSKLFV